MVVLVGTLVCSEAGLKDRTIGFPCEKVGAAGRFCALARAVVHTISSSMVIESLFSADDRVSKCAGLLLLWRIRGEARRAIALLGCLSRKEIGERCVAT